MPPFSNSSLPSFQPTQNPAVDGSYTPPQNPYLSTPNANLFSDSDSERQAKVNKEAQSQSESVGIRRESNFKEVAMRIAAECAQLPDGSPGKANCLERLAGAQKLAASQETLMAGAAPKEAPKTPTPAAAPPRQPTNDHELDEMDGLLLQINAAKDPTILAALHRRLLYIINRRTTREENKTKDDAATKQAEEKAKKVPTPKINAGDATNPPAPGRSPDAFVNNSQDEQKWQARNQASQTTWELYKTGKITLAEFRAQNAATTQKFSPPKPQPQEVGPPDPLNTAHMPPAEQQILTRLRDQLSRTEFLPEPGRTNLRSTIEGQIRDILNYAGAVNTANDASAQHNTTAARIANERENWNNMPQAQRWAQAVSQWTPIPPQR